MRVNGIRGQMWVNLNRSNSTKVRYLFRSGHANLSCLQWETAIKIQISRSAHRQDGARCVSMLEWRNLFCTPAGSLWCSFRSQAQIKLLVPWLDNDQTSLSRERQICQIPHSGGIKICQIPAPCVYPSSRALHRQVHYARGIICGAKSRHIVICFRWIPC